MAKNFRGGMDSLLGETTSKKTAPAAKVRGRPKTNFKEIENSSEIGTKVGETRATFIVNEDRLETIKALAFHERVSIKNVLDSAIKDYLDSRKALIKKAVETYRSRTKDKTK